MVLVCMVRLGCVVRRYVEVNRGESVRMEWTATETDDIDDTDDTMKSLSEYIGADLVPCDTWSEGDATTFATYFMYVGARRLPFVFQPLFFLCTPHTIVPPHHRTASHRRTANLHVRCIFLHACGSMWSSSWPCCCHV